MKKGISLIVLVITIIVIIILAGAVILALINNNPINQASEATFKQTAEGYNSDLSMYISKQYTDDHTYDPTTLDTDESRNVSQVKNGVTEPLGSIDNVITSMKGRDKDIAKFIIQDGKLVYDGGIKKEEQWCKEIYINTLEVADTGTDFIVAKGVNKPKLLPGMTAIKWDGTTCSDVANPDTDTSWYDYTSSTKQWANARTEDGSMWVWVPRYKYSIPDSNYKKGTLGGISIVFEKNIDTTGTGSGHGGEYLTHPAFKFGDKELTGIWVAKFEASNNDVNGVQVLPGQTSANGILMSGIVDKCKSMVLDTRYGWNLEDNNVNSHLLKNTEWGAVAYLTNSEYGQNTIAITKNATNYTGGGVASTYISNASQSTTGNVYGIYDMVGGKSDAVAGNLNSLVSNSTLSTGFNTGSNEKYWDTYTEYTTEYRGDAVYELSNTSVWNNKWLSSSNPFFIRGGFSNSSTGIYDFNSYDGNWWSSVSYRPALVDAGAIDKATVPTEWAGNVSNIIQGVPIPKGFYYVGGDVSTGLVISDNALDASKEIYKSKEDIYYGLQELKGNQFVWIPVDDINNFPVADFTTFAKATNNNVHWWDGSLIPVENYKTSDTTEAAEYNEMAASINKYKGFYVARYEATYDPNGNWNKAQSKSDQSNFIEGSNALIDTCRQMYSATDNAFGVKSHLIYGVEWDAIMKYMKDIPNFLTNGKNLGRFIDDDLSNNISSSAMVESIQNNGNDTTISGKQYYKTTYTYFKTIYYANKYYRYLYFDSEGNQVTWDTEGAIPDYYQSEPVESWDYYDYYQSEEVNSGDPYDWSEERQGPEYEYNYDYTQESTEEVNYWDYTYHQSEGGYFYTDFSFSIPAIKTASDSNYNTKNVYDLIGNTWEVTMEYTPGANYRVDRGGGYEDFEGQIIQDVIDARYKYYSRFSPVQRSLYYPNEPGGRAAMYIK